MIISTRGIMYAWAFFVVLFALVLAVRARQPAVVMVDPGDDPVTAGWDDHRMSDVMMLEGQCKGHVPVGTLSAGDGRIMQLYGRPSGSHRDRWNYYTYVDDQRIPIEMMFKGRRCENDAIGCERAFTGDEMNAVEFGTAAPLRVTMYGD